MPRFLCACLFAALATLCAAAQEKKDAKDDPKSDNKIVGKWKMVSMTPKDGKEQPLEFMGITPILEFTADGNIKVGVDPSSIPPELKAVLQKNPGGAAKLNEMQQVGKYKASGDTVEFLEMKDAGKNSPLGKNKGKLKFDGDTLTITGDDGTVKLTRMKVKKDDEKKPPEKK